MTAPSYQTMYTIIIAIDLNDNNKPFALVQDNVYGANASKNFDTIEAAISHTAQFLNDIAQEIRNSETMPENIPTEGNA